MGRVWIASVPDYGLWGGPLSWFDRRRLVPIAILPGRASCWSLAWLSRQDLLAVGTTINGGSGTRPRVLFLWDYEREEKAWEGTLDRRISAINDGLLYGDCSGRWGICFVCF